MQVEGGTGGETRAEIFARTYRQLRPRAPLPVFRIEFKRFANANSFISMQGNEVTVRITDALETAPAPVLESLAFILLGKLFRKPIPRKHNDRYRRFLNGREMRRRLHLMRQARGWKVLNPPQGEVYDMEEIFEELNLQFFHGLMARPELGWSKRASRATLGHYDPSHNVIVLSKILDRPEVPRLAVEYVLFHEMLHLRYPAEHKGAKRRVHTREFKEAEKQFPELAKALDHLKKL